MNLRLRIVPKLTLVFVLFALALVSGVSSLVYSNARTALQAATISGLLSTSLEKQTALNDWVGERQKNVTALAAAPHLKEVVAGLVADQSDSLNTLRAYELVVADLLPYVQPQGVFLEIMVLDLETGEVLASTDPAQEGKFKENLPFFINGRNGSYVQNVYYSIALQAPAMTASAPIHDEDGRLLAVLAARINLEEMTAIIARHTGLYQSDEAFLVNTSNLFITQPRLITNPAVLQRGVHIEAVNRCLERSSGVISALDYRDVPALISYSWLPERQLCMIVKIDEAEALAPADTLRTTILWASGLTLLAASALAYGLARGITRPIRLLQESVAHFGRGELDYPIEVRNTDEIGELALAMAGMAGSLSDSRAELLTANKELEAFSYSVSHDLRAPLRAINGFSRILLEKHIGNLDAEGVRYFNLVRDNARQMGQLVDDLLAFSRLGRHSLTKVNISLGEFVPRIVDELHAEADGRQVDFILGNLAECRADPVLLQQVFVNLLSNALKFTRGREAARIEVGRESRDGETVYFVKDNGTGFDMRYADKLFGVFQRLHRAEDFEGTGVGLAIVQRIVHRHGGRIWAEAEVDKGAAFYFTI